RRSSSSRAARFRFTMPSMPVHPIERSSRIHPAWHAVRNTESRQGSGSANAGSTPATTRATDGIVSAMMMPARTNKPSAVCAMMRGQAPRWRNSRARPTALAARMTPPIHWSAARYGTNRTIIAVHARRASQTNTLPCTSAGSAVRVERGYEVLRDRGGVPPFDLMPLEHVHQLAVLEQTDLRRRGPIPGEIAARAIGRVDVLARKHGGERARHTLVLERERHRRSRVARGASADRVHHD